MSPTAAAMDRPAARAPLRTSPDSPDDTPLTPRQAAFADAYAECPNGAAAAREAGYAHGSARVAAARNLKRSGVVLRILARRREQAAARLERRTQIAGLLDEALAFARERRNPSALARIAGLMMRLDGLDRSPADDDRLLVDATPDQIEDLLAAYEVAAGAADPEVPDPSSATIEELAARAAELMETARDKTRNRLRWGTGRAAREGRAPLPGLPGADGYLAGLLDHLDRGVRGATDACAFARLTDEAAAGSPALDWTTPDWTGPQCTAPDAPWDGQDGGNHDGGGDSDGPARDAHGMAPESRGGHEGVAIADDNG